MQKAQAFRVVRCRGEMKVERVPELGDEMRTNRENVQAGTELPPDMLLVARLRHGHVECRGLGVAEVLPYIPEQAKEGLDGDMWRLCAPQHPNHPRRSGPEWPGARRMCPPVTAGVCMTAPLSIRLVEFEG